MHRILLIAAAALLALAGCSPDAQNSSSAGADGERGGLRPVQSSDKPEITPEKITRDIVGRKIRVSDVTGIGPPTEWTFEADEVKHAEILEQHKTEKGLTIIVLMTTHNNPRADEDNVQVSGKLQLHYEWRIVRWVLTSIDNLTFRYSLGLAT